MSEHRLKGQRSGVEPPQSTTSAKKNILITRGVYLTTNKIHHTKGIIGTAKHYHNPRKIPTSSISSLWLGSRTGLSLIIRLNYVMNGNNNYCIIKLIHIIHLLYKWILLEIYKWYLLHRFIYLFDVMPQAVSIKMLKEEAACVQFM